MDAFTIQNTDIILDPEQYKKDWRKWAMSEAMVTGGEIVAM